ncbi:MAG TPA: hypothetical protein DDW50_17655 [Firmicutes bacterium]|jgi:hypothetical protein|nr:hypothetical protein [Bacillota bacterium]
MAEIFEDPANKELKSFIAIEKLIKDKLDPKLMSYFQYILNKWQNGDENIRGWLNIQLEGCKGEKTKE